MSIAESTNAFRFQLFHFFLYFSDFSFSLCSFGFFSPSSFFSLFHNTHVSEMFPLQPFVIITGNLQHFRHGLLMLGRTLLEFFCQSVDPRLHRHDTLSGLNEKCTCKKEREIQKIEKEKPIKKYIRMLSIERGSLPSLNPRWFDEKQDRVEYQPTASCLQVGKPQRLGHEQLVLRCQCWYCRGWCPEQR